MELYYRIKSNYVLRVIILLSILLVILTYIRYRPTTWPYGREAAGCLIALFMLSATAFLLWRLKDKFINDMQKKYVAIGLCFGLLWTIEISINNFIRPDVPLRDIIDNIFFSIIAVLIFVRAAWDAYHTNNFSEGLKSGFWSGISSGAVACLTALAVIVFGMKYILLDPLNLKEWADVKSKANSPDMDVYFAYETFAGAIMHLFILGALMGVVLGTIGGLTGKIIGIIKSINTNYKINTDK
jgi:hypothetical protein